MKIVAALFLLFLSRPALATFHETRVNEVMVSKSGNTNAQFIELFDPFAEPYPSASAPYEVSVFDAQGVQIGSSIALSRTTLVAVASVRPFLISTSVADAAFGVTGDAVLSVTLPTSGQACFDATGSHVHCLAWGNVTTVLTGFSGNDSGPTPPDNESLQFQSPGVYAIADPTPAATNAVAPPADLSGGVIDLAVVSDLSMPKDLAGSDGAIATPDLRFPDLFDLSTASDLSQGGSHASSGGGCGCDLAHHGSTSAALLLFLGLVLAIPVAAANWREVRKKSKFRA